ncbi:hypothetical protein Tco_0591888 [Tanacetum coccineum]
MEKEDDSENTESDELISTDLRTRSSPQNTYLVAHHILNSDSLKKFVEDMGFGKILRLSAEIIPYNLGWSILSVYDHENRSLLLNGERIMITKDLVHEIFGFLAGDLTISFVKRYDWCSVVLKSLDMNPPDLQHNCATNKYCGPITFLTFVYIRWLFLRTKSNQCVIDYYSTNLLKRVDFEHIKLKNFGQFFADEERFFTEKNIRLVEEPVYHLDNLLLIEIKPIKEDKSKEVVSDSLENFESSQFRELVSPQVNDLTIIESEEVITGLNRCISHFSSFDDVLLRLGKQTTIFKDNKEVMFLKNKLLSILEDYSKRVYKWGIDSTSEQHIQDFDEDNLFERIDSIVCPKNVDSELLTSEDQLKKFDFDEERTYDLLTSEDQLKELNYLNDVILLKADEYSISEEAENEKVRIFADSFNESDITTDVQQSKKEESLKAFEFIFDETDNKQMDGVQSFVFEDLQEKLDIGNQQLEVEIFSNENQNVRKINMKVEALKSVVIGESSKELFVEEFEKEMEIEQHEEYRKQDNVSVIQEVLHHSSSLIQSEEIFKSDFLNDEQSIHEKGEDNTAHHNEMIVHLPISPSDNVPPYIIEDFNSSDEILKYYEKNLKEKDLVHGGILAKVIIVNKRIEDVNNKQGYYVHSIINGTSSQSYKQNKEFVFKKYSVTINPERKLAEEKMGKTSPLKSALKSLSSDATILASKIQNIEGKIRMPIYNVTFTQPLNYNNNARNEYPLGESDQPNPPKDGMSNDQPTKGFGTSSIASILNADKKTPKINFRFAYSLVAFFVVKSVAFLLVQNYVTNTWSKFGFQKVIRDDNDVFYFKFTSSTGLSKDKVSKVPVFGFARALIEISTDKDLKREITMVVLIINGEGHTKEQMNVEYEWKPPRCTDCLVFRHDTNECPKRVVESVKETPEKQTNGSKPNASGDEAFIVKLKNTFTALQDDEDVSTGNEKVIVKLRKFEMSILSILQNRILRGQALLPRLFPMFSIASWNIQGLNRTPKQSEVRQVVSENQLSVCAILESHVDLNSLSTVCNKLCHFWDWTLNASLCNKGDFNVALNMEDSFSGSSRMNSAMCDFKDCVENIVVFDINSFGLHYMWNQKPKGRVPYKISDHSPLVLKIPSLIVSKPKPFKFYNFLAHKEKFLEVTTSHWNKHIEGHSMYRVVQKLKSLKKLFLKLLHEQDEEAAYLQAFNNAKVDEECFLRQKAKIEWLEVLCNSVSDVFVSYYQSFLGADLVCDNLDSVGLDDNAPGPDGYTAAFFKKGWDVVGQEVCNAIRDFFVNGKLLKEINHTVISLIPKELMHNYHHDRGPPRCAFKVDIQKAYDTVDWRFLGYILKCFGFHHVMFNWIMACVTSTSYSISINGDIHGFFKGKIGLRQGDPLSPYLFTLVMEILTLILQRRVSMSDSFRYHKHCEELKIINVCFADDLFLFARGDVDSARVIIDSLNEFKNVSGLVPNIPKSTAFFCNVLNHVKIGILNIMLFSEGELPTNYLGATHFISSSK